ncbi:hypothetical protein RQP46_005871 [Phenoliferia psychrophenolica]
MVKPLANSKHQSFAYGSPAQEESGKLASKAEGNLNPRLRYLSTPNEVAAQDLAAAAALAPQPTISLKQSERSLLSLLSTLSAPTLSDPNLFAHLQALKTALFNQDEKAFAGDDDLARRVYAVKHVPSHAVMLRKIFVEMGLREMLKEGGDVVALGGGGGSELLALGSLLSTPSVTTSPVRLTTYDRVNWSSVLEPQLAALSSAAPTLALTLSSHTHDILSLPLPSFPPSPTLITLNFTASELFAQSRPATVALLSHLASTCPSGTRILIIESAALSLIPVGKDGRTYPMGTLVDHALGKAWEVVREEENQWHRLPEGVAECYPLKLENSRVFLRLYEKVEI